MIESAVPKSTSFVCSKLSFNFSNNSDSSSIFRPFLFFSVNFPYPELKSNQHIGIFSKLFAVYLLDRLLDGILRGNRHCENLSQQSRAREYCIPVIRRRRRPATAAAAKASIKK